MDFRCQDLVHCIRIEITFKILHSKADFVEYGAKSLKHRKNIWKGWGTTSSVLKMSSQNVTYRLTYVKYGSKYVKYWFKYVKYVLKNRKPILKSYKEMLKPSQTKPNQAKPNQTKPNQTKPSQNKPSQAKPSQTKPSQAKPNHGAMVLCIGPSIGPSNRIHNPSICW